MAAGLNRGKLLAATSSAAVCALAAGCGGHPSLQPRPKPDPPPTIIAECGALQSTHARARWLKTSDAQRLYAITTGSGTTGLVLVPESPPGNACGWLPYIATLERAGLRVLALDYRGTGDSIVRHSRNPYAFGRDLAAAVEQLRRDGAKKVILVGASFGGAAAIEFAPQMDVDGVISLSGETALPEYHVDALSAAPHLHVPLLIVGTRHDGYLSVGQARTILHNAGGSDKHALFFPGAWHGWDIVENAPYAREARKQILRWIRTHA